MKNKNIQSNHPDAHVFGENLSPIFQDENRANNHFTDSSRILTDEARGTVSERQPDNSSYALKLKAIDRIFTDEARGKATDNLPTTSIIKSGEPSYALQLAAIDQIFSDSPKDSQQNTVSYGDQLESMPQIFQETDTSSLHPAARRFEGKNKNPLFRDESRGPLPNIKLEIPIKPIQAPAGEPVATMTETEPTAVETDTTAAPLLDKTGNPDEEPVLIRPATTTPEASGNNDMEAPLDSHAIDIRRRRRVGSVALAGLFAGIFITNRFGSNFLDKSK